MTVREVTKGIKATLGEHVKIEFVKERPRGFQGQADFGRKSI